jgi:hypothetical protein
MSAGRLLVEALRAPEAVRIDDWPALISAARSEQLIGSLAFRFERVKVPPRIEALFAAVREECAQTSTQAIWEAEMARRALSGLEVPIVLLKGTAFHAAGLDAAIGRSVGDLDILVPREALDSVEAALIVAGWERLKPADGYDDLYYRKWMHEIAPLIHRTRDRMIDIHHTILPLTARPRPNAEALIGASVELGNGFRVLSPEDMIVHAAAHLFADGDLAGGLRNLWDVDRLIRQFAQDPDFWARLSERSRLHQLTAPVALALRLSRKLYQTPVDPHAAGKNTFMDRWFEARLLARNGWGQESRRVLRFAFYVRSHWLRMPPHLLARHLWVKATRSKAPAEA